MCHDASDALRHHWRQALGKRLRQQLFQLVWLLVRLHEEEIKQRRVSRGRRCGTQWSNRTCAGMARVSDSRIELCSSGSTRVCTSAEIRGPSTLQNNMILRHTHTHTSRQLQSTGRKTYRASLSKTTSRCP